MSEQPLLSQSSEITSSTPPPNSSDARSKSTEANKSIGSVVALCSLGMIGCFFLPWIQLLFAELSGYQIQQIPGEEAKFVWIVPIMAFISLVAGLTKQSVRAASQLAGVVPFLILFYYYKQVGQDLFNALRPGAYLTLFLAAVLLIAPHVLKTEKKG